MSAVLPRRPVTLLPTTAAALLAAALLAPGPAAAAPGTAAHAGSPTSATAAPASPRAEVGSTRTITTLPFGSFLEGVAVGPDGAAYVTDAFAGRILRVSRAGDVSTVARFPTVEGSSITGGPLALVGTVAFGPDRRLYATYLNTERPELTGVYRVTRSGTELVTRFPRGATPNGITVDRDGSIYVADSALGLVWRSRPGQALATAWVRDPLLAPVPGVAFPAANGVKRFGNAFYVSNPASAQVVRIPVRAGGRAGAPSTYARDVAIDDFAFDARGNLYGTTHPFDTVVRVARDGSTTVVAGVEDGIIGPTAAAFGTAPGDRTGLYVVTDGGLFGSQLDPAAPTGPASLVRLETGVPGSRP